VNEIDDGAADDWPLSTPQAQGLDGAAVAAALEAGAAVPGLRALVAARHGHIVAERYYGGAHADSLLAINSATKSVCSMLVGPVLHEGRLPGLDRPLAELAPATFEQAPGSPAARVTLRALLTGRSGQAFDSAQLASVAAARSLVRLALAQPDTPADGWTYNDAMVALLSPVLEHAQGVDIAEQAARRLFAPLGITRWTWRRDRSGQPISSAGIALRPRDLLKLAALMAAGGRWQGAQVLPADWVSQSLASAGPASWRARPVEDVGYGYLWFSGRLHGQPVAWAWGYGGQFALLAPALDLVVATAATAPLAAALQPQTDEVMGLVGRLVQAAS
jgi:CubicO group peptidase (beta-lactamase class C family)